MVVGSLAGLMTLGGLFVFAYLASTDPDFACNSFTLLAPIFAFGAGLAAAFMGGAAAISGQLGDSARRNALSYSAGGGIAAFFIAFILFQQFQPPNCTAPREATLELTRLPQGITVSSISGLWQQRHDKTEEGIFDLRYLIKADQEGHQQHYVNLKPTEGSGCSLYIEVVDQLNARTTLRDAYEVANSSGAGSTVKLIYSARTGDNPIKASDPSCFTVDRQPVVEYVAISPNGSGAIYGRSLKPALDQEGSGAVQLLGGEEEFGSLPVAVDPLGLFGISPAFAQDPVPPFALIRDQLLSPDPNVRVSARQYLTENFHLFSYMIVEEVLNPDAPDGDYLASLLSALIAGIDVATNGELAPGQARDLTRTLPFVAGSEARIIELTAHPDAAVRKQARRLIQRYPVDAFATVYDPMLAAAAEGDCDIRPDRDESQAILYSAIFYTYNRIVQKSVAPTLTPAEADDAENIAERTLSAAACLDENLRVDSALIHYGLATLYSEVGNAGDEKAAYAALAKESADRFLDTVAVNGGGTDYYFQAHVASMQALAG